MKNLFLTLTFFVCLAITAGAQVGVRAGLNLASYSSSQDGVTLSSDSKVGVHFGITNDFKLSDKVTFRPGLLYSAKGGVLNLDFGGISEKSSSTFTYLDIPLSFVYNFTGEDKGFFVEVGPNVGFLLAAKSEGEDVKESLKSLDFGLNIGLGYDLGQFIVGANYGFGLANIAELADGEDGKLTNKNIAIYALYQF